VIRLLLVELARFRSRRAIMLLGALAVLVAIVLAGVTTYQTRPLTASDRADAAAQADLNSRDSLLQGEVKDCKSNPEAFLGPNATAAECDTTIVPSAADYYPRKALDLGTVLSHQNLFNSSGFGLALILVGLMIIAGCTFAGADWGSGSITNQLIFESRRTRLWLAKAGAVVLGSGAIAVVTLGGFWLALWLVAGARGIDVSSAEAGHVVWHVVRAVALTTGAALGGFALTMIFRHTVATLALLFVYSVGGEIAVGLLPVEGAGRFSVGNNVFGWLATRQRYFDSTIDCSPSERCSNIQTMTHLESGLFLGVLLVVAVAVSLLWFRRKDV
jgi:ABC-2 type transport system permease protein